MENSPDLGATSDMATPGIADLFGGMPAIHIPQPFNLADPSNKEGLDKLKREINEKVEHWESRMTTFFGEYEEYTDSWRVSARRQNNKPKALFNSISGETHRATETLATFWFRNLTAADPFYEAVGEGLNEFGQEPSEIELYAVEATLRKQLQFIRFKEKLLRGLRSLSLFGTMIVENPFVSFPYGDGDKSFEGTDFVLRPLLTTGFNPFVFDLDLSDYIFTMDFPTVYMLRNWAKSDKKNWDLAKIEEVFEKAKNVNSPGSEKSVTYNRVLQRKQRAGYNILDNSNWELVNYHGRIDTENDVVQKYWESEGRQDDPGMCDFSAGVLQGEGIVRFHATPFKTWHHLFKTASFKSFEMEPLGYGVGKIGRKRQKELNATESRSNDMLMFNILPMFKLGKYAGIDVSKLTIKPWSFVEMEDINQLEQIKTDLNGLAHSINMQNIWKEDFRATTGASTNLQAAATAATATEATITQNEAIRGASVIAEVIADTFLRDFLMTSHINNTYLMDQGFYVKVTGVERPFYVNKDNLPINVGFNLRLTTDKDFRPDRIGKILEALQVATSVRNIVPASMNVVAPLFEQLFHALGMNPRLLQKPVPLVDQMLSQMQRQQRMGGGAQGQMGVTDNASEVGGEAAGSGANVVSTPVGPVPSSPAASTSVQMSA